MKNKILILSTLIIGTLSHGQTGSPPPVATNPSMAITNSNFAWYRGGNFPNGQAGTNNIFGTRWASNIWIMGNNEVTSFFSHNNGLYGLSNTGDGLRILNPTPGVTGGLGQIDIFTSTSNVTEIRFGGSGNIRGANLRFEEWAHYNGFFFNTSLIGGTGVYKFARAGNITGFIGTNNFWRIGMQLDAQNFNGARRLEVVDNTQQFRLTFADPNVAAGPFTDFLSNGAGNLQIQPSGGRVGINANTNPLATLDVFGDVRIRDVQSAVPDALFVGIEASGASNPQDLSVRRLDFTGNPTDVLLGNGTWGSLPPPNPPGPNLLADNGVSRTINIFRLGDGYNPFPQPFNTNTPLTANRQVRLNNNNFIFSGSGNVGIGLNWPALPTEVLDVNGNSRFRNVPTQGGQSLVLGLQQGANSNDIELSRLAFPNDPNQVLLGNGTWGIMSTGGSASAAHNGTTMSAIDPTKVAFGQNVGQGGNPGELLNNREVPMNNHSIYFTDNNATVSGENRIGVGTSNPMARMHIEVNSQIQENSPVATIIDNNQNTLNGIATGLIVNMAGSNTFNTGEFMSISGAQVNTGIDAQAIQNANFNNGVFGRANNGLLANHGVVGEAVSFNNVGNANFGVQGIARNGNNNFGGQFIGEGNNNINNYGIFALANGSATNNFGVFAQATNTGTNNFAGFFQGNVHVQGNLTIPGGTVTASDIQFKTNVQNLSGALTLINQLQPRTYNFDTINYSDFGFEQDQQMGLVAQEVEQIIPNIVSSHIRPAQYDSLGVQILPELTYKGIEYEELIPLLIAGIQEQDNRIDSLTTVNTTVNNYNDSLVQAVADLNARLTLLENCLSNILPALCNANQMAVQQTPEETQEYLERTINVTLSNRNNIVLNQNVPNPFAESTVITFTIPATVQKAQIHFYDGTGKLINSVDIVERGNGQLNVFANDLSTGVYSYSLVADGQIVSTKRMMKQ